MQVQMTLLFLILVTLSPTQISIYTSWIGCSKRTYKTFSHTWWFPSSFQLNFLLLPFLQPPFVCLCLSLLLLLLPAMPQT